jgi:transposase
MTVCWFTGIDWADTHHDSVILDQEGHLVGKPFRVDHTPKGLDALIERLKLVLGQHPPEAMACILETRQGLLITALLEAGFVVYPVNPFLVKERRKASGAKTDAIDATILARIGRSELADLHPLEPDRPLIQELKEVTRDQDLLIRDQTRVLNQLTACLKAYYPQALTLFSDLNQKSTLAFLQAYPTPQAAREASQEQMTRVLKEAGYPQASTKATQIRKMVAQRALQANAITIRTKSRLLQGLLKQMEVLREQIASYDEEITRLFLSHESSGLLQSIPRVGPRIGPRLLAELGDQMDRYGDVHALQALAGTCPVPYASGNFHQDRARRSCKKPLRNAVQQLARQSTLCEGWAKQAYQRKRKEGKKYQEALRGVGNTGVRIVFAMLVQEQAYDAQVFEQAQAQHAVRRA